MRRQTEQSLQGCRLACLPSEPSHIATLGFLWESIFKDFLIYLKESRERESPICWSLPKWLQLAWASSRSPTWVTETQALGHLVLLFKAINRALDWKWSHQDMNQWPRGMMVSQALSYYASTERELSVQHSLPTDEPLLKSSFTGESSDCIGWPARPITTQSQLSIHSQFSPHTQCLESTWAHCLPLCTLPHKTSTHLSSHS